MEGFGAAELLGWTTASLALAAELRGWTEPAIERLELGWNAAEQRVVIPVRDELLDELGELRYDPTGRRTPKMLAEAGTPRALFPPPEAIGDGELRDRWLLLLEGEPDTIRAWSLGLAAVGVPGAGSWRAEWAARFSGRRWRVLVLFDSDSTGRENAERAAADLTAAGVDARLLDLDADRDDGYDLTDWAKLAASADDREQACRLLLRLAEATPLYEPPPPEGGKPWRSVPWSTFRDTAPPAQTWLVDGLMPAGALCFIAGPPKRGKTWIGLGLALALALGRPLVQFDTSEARDVLYVALEGSQTGLRTRIGALCRGFGANPDGDELDRLHMLYRPRPFDLSELAGAAWLAEEALAVDAALILVDVLRAAARFDENAAADFARIRDHLDPLLAEGRTVALLHHFGKLSDTQRERSPGERMAGTGAMYGALDVGLLITRSSDGARRLGVVVEARDFAAPDSLALAIHGDGTGRHGGFRYDDRATIITDEQADEHRDLVALAEAALAADGEWLTARELAASPEKGGVGANIDELRAALEPACTPNPPGTPSRLVRLVKGTAVGRAGTAQPYGTWQMYEALLDPRPDRLYASEPVRAGSLFDGLPEQAQPTGSSLREEAEEEPVG